MSEMQWTHGPWTLTATPGDARGEVKVDAVRYTKRSGTRHGHYVRTATGDVVTVSMADARINAHLRTRKAAAILAGVTDVEPWSAEDARRYRDAARNVMSGDAHHNGGHGGYSDDETLSSCGQCALRGYGEHDDSGLLEPNYAGWGRAYVESGTPVPARWRDALERDARERTPYGDALRRSIATFGVTYAS